MEAPISFNMLGIYIHIPFCLKKCGYCDFYSEPTKTEDIPVKPYLEAIKRQIEISASNYNLDGCAVSSIFFGGGTPSLMPVDFFGELLGYLRDKFLFVDDVEISCEVNPAAADRQWFDGVRGAGVNRISIGVQSFQPVLLKKLGRLHSAGDAMNCIADAQDAGFASVSVDMMYAIPGQDLKMLEDDLKTAMTFQTEHISAYALTIEDGTPFALIPLMGLSPEGLGDDNSLKHMRTTARMLVRGGWHRYEISNFARKGFECRHNMNYWHYGEYLGLGAGATSFLKMEGDNNGYALRFTGIKNVPSYINDPSSAVDVDPISKRMAMGEFCFLGLRTTVGISLKQFESEFGCQLDDVYNDASCKLIEQGLVDRDEDRLWLTDKGIELSNQVFQAFV